MRRSIFPVGPLALATLILGFGGFVTASHASGVTGVQWNGIGPAPVEVDGPAPGNTDPKKFQGVGPDSGEIADIAIDPRSNNQTIFVATEAGGLWRSTDGGATWATTTDFLTSLSMGAVALDAGDASIVYAGTGNTQQQGFFKGVGVYVSTDGGQNWTLAPGSGTLIDVVNGVPTGKGIARLVSPAKNTILVGTNPGFNGVASGLNNGVYRSADGGATFTQTLVGQIDDLHLDTTAANTVIAAVDSQGLFISTDGGQTWGGNLWTATNGSPLALPPAANFTPGFITFGQSTKPNHNTIYASVQNTNANAANPKWGLFVSTDNGMNWTQATANGNPSANCGNCAYGQPVAVEPNTASTVYVGFVNLSVSTDSGANFALADSPGGNLQVHNDWHALTFSPNVPASGNTPLFGGTDGGIAMTPDGGGTWTNINGTADASGNTTGRALATTLFRAIDIGRGNSAASCAVASDCGAGGVCTAGRCTAGDARHTASNNAYTYGGMQDAATAGFRGGDTPTTWHIGIDGDGVGVAVDVTNREHVIGGDDGCPIVTTDAGDTWTSSGGLTDTSSHTDGMPAFNFGQIDAIDPNNGKNVYISVDSQNAGPPRSGCIPPGRATQFGVWFSTDSGNNYALMKAFTAEVRAITAVKIDSNTLWVGLKDGTLAYTTNALSGTSATWTAVTIPGAPAQPVTGIAIDPTNTQTVAVTYPGFCGATCNNNANLHVFLTTNNGTTWRDISGTLGGGINNLPDLPVHTVVIDPTTNPHTILVGNDAGVLQTADGGKTWQVLGLGMPTVDVVSLALDTSVTPELLRAGTFGRSAFQLGAPTGPLLAINSTFNVGTVCPGQTPTELLQLFNVGASNLTITSISEVAGSADFTLSGPPFPVTITPGEELDYTLGFTPKLANEGTTETATFQIDSNDTFKPTQQVTYTATVGAPNGSTVIANSGNFGNVCVGSFADLNLTIANKGTCDLLVSNITSSDADFLPPSTLVYPLAVQAGTTLAAPVRFAPLSFGTKNGTITVASSNNPSGNMSVSVMGTAPPGKIAVSGSGMFGNVCAGTLAQQTITVGNVGPCNLNVTSVTIDNGSGGACPDFTIQNNPFPNILSSNSSLPVTIAFTPTSIGTKTCRLVIVSDDPSTPTVTVPLTATTPAVNIDVPPDTGVAGFNFPATVIQSVGACSSAVPFPVSNNGSCPVGITGVAIGAPGSNPADYALMGLPSLTTPLQPGHVLGEGNLKTVFKPTVVTRGETGTLKVTWESDPITHATTSASRSLCGEGVSRGARVLVTAGGTPLANVDHIQLHRLDSNRKSISVDNVVNAPLQTVTQPAPCASFQFQREWGGVTNPIQLTAGDYQITVDATVNHKKVSKTVSFTLGTCDFNQNIVVAF